MNGNNINLKSSDRKQSCEERLWKRVNHVEIRSMDYWITEPMQEVQSKKLIDWYDHEAAVEKTQKNSTHETLTINIKDHYW